MGWQRSRKSANVQGRRRFRAPFYCPGDRAVCIDGYVLPQSFTHGMFAWRARWFRAGLQKGDIHPCATFSAGNL